MNTGTQSMQPDSGQINGKVHTFGIKAEATQLPRSEQRVVDTKQFTTAEYHRLIKNLQKRLVTQSDNMESYKVNEQQLSKRSRRQRKLIQHLRELISAQAIEIARLESNSPKFASVNCESSRKQRRVVSLDGALQRINGVDVAQAPQALSSAKFEDFGMEEFQPIQEHQPQGKFGELLNFVKVLSSRYIVPMAGSIRQQAGERWQYLQSLRLKANANKAEECISHGVALGKAATTYTSVQSSSDR